MEDTTVIILAAGRGTRMNSKLPKVLIELNGKPMLDRIIENCIKISDRILIIVSNTNQDQIQQHLQHKEYYAKIKFVIQKWPMGTGHAIQECLPVLTPNDKNILIINGDMPLITHKLLREIIDTPVPCIATTYLSNPYGYGRIIELDNKIIGIIEQKDCNKVENNIDNVNVGIYLFNYDIISNYIKDIKLNTNKNEYYITDMVRILVNNNININNFVVPHNLQYQINGVNTPQELCNLELQVLSKKINFN